MINLNTLEGQLRLETGDVSDVAVMSDAEYTYILSQHNNVVKDSVLDALYAILAYQYHYNTLANQSQFIINLLVSFYL